MYMWGGGECYTQTSRTRRGQAEGFGERAGERQLPGKDFELNLLCVPEPQRRETDSNHSHVPSYPTAPGGDCHTREKQPCILHSQVNATFREAHFPHNGQPCLKRLIAGQSIRLTAECSSLNGVHHCQGSGTVTKRGGG